MRGVVRGGDLLLTLSGSRCASTAMSLPASTAFCMHFASAAVKRSMLDLLGASQLPQSILHVHGRVGAENRMDTHLTLPHLQFAYADTSSAACHPKSIRPSHTRTHGPRSTARHGRVGGWGEC